MAPGRRACRGCADVHVGRGVCDVMPVARYDALAGAAQLRGIAAERQWNRNANGVWQVRRSPKRRHIHICSHSRRTARKAAPQVITPPTFAPLSTCQPGCPRAPAVHPAGVRGVHLGARERDSALPRHLLLVAYRHPLPGRPPHLHVRAAARRPHRPRAHQVQPTPGGRARNAWRGAGVCVARAQERRFRTASAVGT